jgi:hypothetical protein
MLPTYTNKLVGIGLDICVNDVIVPVIVDGRKGSKEHMTEKKQSVIMFFQLVCEEFDYRYVPFDEEIILLHAKTILAARNLSQRKYNGAWSTEGEPIDMQTDDDSGA